MRPPAGRVRVTERKKRKNKPKTHTQAGEAREGLLRALSSNRASLETGGSILDFNFSLVTHTPCLTSPSCSSPTLPSSPLLPLPPLPPSSLALHLHRLRPLLLLLLLLPHRCCTCLRGKREIATVKHPRRDSASRDVNISSLVFEKLRRDHVEQILTGPLRSRTPTGSARQGGEPVALYSLTILPHSISASGTRITSGFSSSL